VIKSKEYEVDETCGWELHTEFQYEHLNGRCNLEDVDVDGGIMLKREFWNGRVWWPL
jgi:hypothetical protein